MVPGEMDVDRALTCLDRRLQDAVAGYWMTRQAQMHIQQRRGGRDQGLRAAVTGGAQRDGFLELVADRLQAIGVPASCIHFHQHLELPGFFRPTKIWWW